MEHDLSPESRVARWQHRLTPCWKRIAGGCHFDRKVDDLIRAADLAPVIAAMREGVTTATAIATAFSAHQGPPRRHIIEIHADLPNPIFGQPWPLPAGSGIAWPWYMKVISFGPFI